MKQTTTVRKPTAPSARGGKKPASRQELSHRKAKAQLASALRPPRCIVTMREADGLTFPAIAEERGVSVSKARRMYAAAKYARGETFVESTRSPYFGLSERSADAAKNARLRNRKEIQAALDSGDLHPASKRYPGFGWSVCFELSTWAARSGGAEPKGR